MMAPPLPVREDHTYMGRPGTSGEPEYEVEEVVEDGIVTGEEEIVEEIIEEAGSSLY